MERAMWRRTCQSMGLRQGRNEPRGVQSNRDTRRVGARWIRRRQQSKWKIFHLDCLIPVSKSQLLLSHVYDFNTGGRREGEMGSRQVGIDFEVEDFHRDNRTAVANRSRWRRAGDRLDHDSVFLAEIILH